MRTLLLRRAGLLATVPDLRVVGAPESEGIRAVFEWASAHGHTISIDDVSALLEEARLGALNLGEEDLPLVFTRSGELLRNPGPEDLARAFPAPRGAAEADPADESEWT